MTAEQLQAVGAVLIALTGLVSAIGVVINLFFVHGARGDLRLVSQKVDGHMTETNHLLERSLAGNIAASGVTPDQLVEPRIPETGSAETGANRG